MFVFEKFKITIFLKMFIFEKCSQKIVFVFENGSYLKKFNFFRKFTFLKYMKRFYLGWWFNNRSIKKGLL
jgi:hypothetical protein